MYPLPGVALVFIYQQLLIVGCRRYIRGYGTVASYQQFLIVGFG
jgi:hypothetical protein